MKRLFYQLTSVILFSCLPLLSLLAQGEKRALIIAVGDYNKAETGWNPISSKNDIPLVKGALLSQGFSTENIRVIVDENAKAIDILNALDQLLKEAQPNDVIVIHYSGHGQQITDDNNDEVDNYDEAMVPYDAQARFRKGIYEGENHIRDDEIGKRLGQLRKKVGKNGSVLLIMDSCHSGTASRGIAKARGTQEAFDTSTPKAVVNKSEDGLYGLEDYSENQKDLAPLICFYGASAHELNYETKDPEGNGVGSLSLAFSDAFANATPTQSYAELFDQIKISMSVMAPRQTPQAEGDLNNVILGGKIAGKKPYFTVSSLEDDKTIVIDGGNLMGVFENSELTFYPLGAEQTEENKVATGLVTKADATSAQITLTWKKENADLKSAKGVLTKVNYGSIAVSVKLDVKAPELEKELKVEFSKYPLITLVDENPDLLIEENNAHTRGEKLFLVTSQEYELFGESYSDVQLTSKKITEKVLAFAQSKYLRQVEMMNEDLELSFEFILITAEKNANKIWEESGRLPLETRKDTSGNIAFVEGDFFKIKVINNGFEVAYFSMLDFQPDNIINVLIPGKYESAADFSVKPGEEKELSKVFRFGKPFGTEVFKLVASSQPIAFRDILISKGDQRSAAFTNNNPFAELVSSSFRSEQTARSEETPSVPTGNCNIYSVSFSIMPKK